MEVLGNHESMHDLAFYAKTHPQNLEMDKELLLFRTPAAESALFSENTWIPLNALKFHEFYVILLNSLEFCETTTFL